MPMRRATAHFENTASTFFGINFPAVLLAAAQENLRCKPYREDRGNIDPSDYIVEKLKDETVGKMPGKVNGQQFIIQNCEVSTKL